MDLFCCLFFVEKGDDDNDEVPMSLWHGIHCSHQDVTNFPSPEPIVEYGKSTVCFLIFNVCLF